MKYPFTNLHRLYLNLIFILKIYVKMLTVVDSEMRFYLILFSHCTYMFTDFSTMHLCSCVNNKTYY